MLCYKISKSLIQNYISKRYSALFINGPKATDNCVFVIPHIDFEERIQQKDKLQEELLKRKSIFDLIQLQHLWSVYKDLKHQKSSYEEKKAEIGKQFASLQKNEPNEEGMMKLKIQLNLLKDNLKKIKEPLWSAEEAAILEVLKLPNSLHPDTPVIQNEVLYTHLTPPNTPINHLKAAIDQNLLEFNTNENYYLKGNAAIFELGAKFYFSNLLKKNNFVQFSNSDFVKSVIIEGCGLDHKNPESSFILHNNDDNRDNAENKLHLTGGGSLHSFMAYYAKNVLYSKVFPLKHFSIGRQYVPTSSEEHSLFHVSQSSVVQLFVVTKDSKDLNIMLKDIIEMFKLLFSQLGYHYRICAVSADKLQMWESYRVIVEMFSTSLGKYIEIANISMSDDFISKRLMFTFVDKKKSHFPHILSGTVLNVPRFLGCVLEQNEKFILPEQFGVDKWSIS